MQPARKVQAVALFGGSFDPPHAGHAHAVRMALAEPRIGGVWLLPAYKHRAGKRMAAFEHRLEMARLLVADEPRAKVLDTERRVGGDGKSVTLVRLLVKRHPETPFRFVVGEDVAAHFDQWPGAPEIQRLAPLLVVPRMAGPAGAPLSSTGLRAALASGTNPGPAMLPSPVAAYALGHKLY